MVRGPDQFENARRTKFARIALWTDMSDLHLDIWRGVEPLRKNADAWDNLWERSTVEQPAARSKPLVAWLESFAKNRKVQTLVVRHGNQLVAALPLVGRRYRHYVPVASLARNSWSYAGELLLDARGNAHAACRLMIENCRRLRMPLVRFEDVPYTSIHWRIFFSAMKNRKIDFKRTETFLVETVKMGDDWDAYKRSCSKNLRKKMQRLSRRLDSQGKVDFACYKNLSTEQVAPLMKQGFEIEDRSWKGQAGTSVLGSPGMFEFFLRQAKALAADGHLCLSFLSCGDRPIAFEYGWISKGVYFSPKVAYDPEYSNFSPGHLLLWRLFERFHSSDQVSRVDFTGPATEATSRWATGSYPVGHVTAAPPGLVGLSGRVALRAVTHERPSRPRERRSYEDILVGRKPSVSPAG